MKSELTKIITEIASNYLGDFQTKSVKELFDTLINLRPSFKESLLNIKDTKDIENIFNEITGILNIDAGTGTIDIDNALILAIQTATFDHDKGTVTINNTTISAPKLITGGNSDATGETVIKDSTLQSKGTQITGKNFQIKITGNAKIVQN